MNRPEEQLQRSIVEWLEWNRRRWRGELVYFAVPNQRGTRKRFEAGVLKALGVRPGVSDLVFFCSGGRAFCVELKAPGREGRVSEAQWAWLEDCARVNVPVHVISSLEDFVGVLERYKILRPGRRSNQGRLWGP